MLICLACAPTHLEDWFQLHLPSGFLKDCHDHTEPILQIQEEVKHFSYADACCIKRKTCVSWNQPQSYEKGGGGGTSIWDTNQEGAAGEGKPQAFHKLNKICPAAQITNLTDM